VTPGEHVYWRCPQCSAEVGEPCKDLPEGRYHHERQHRASFARKYGDTMAIFCPSCRAPPGEPCKKTVKKNQFGNIPGGIADFPHSSRMRALKGEFPKEALVEYRVQGWIGVGPNSSNGWFDDDREPGHEELAHAFTEARLRLAEGHQKVRVVRLVHELEVIEVLEAP
jgi:hypothetical protein